VGMKRACGLGILVLIGTLAAARAEVAAPPSLNGDAMILYASNDKGGIDGKIGKLPQLKKPPFSQFKSYKLLERAKLTLAKDVAASLSLPSGAVISITYKGVTQPKKAGDPVLAALVATLKKADGSSLPSQGISAKLGDTVFVSGGSFKTGVILVAVKLTP